MVSKEEVLEYKKILGDIDYYANSEDDNLQKVALNLCISLSGKMRIEDFMEEEKEAEFENIRMRLRRIFEVKEIVTRMQIKSFYNKLKEFVDYLEENVAVKRTP